MDKAQMSFENHSVMSFKDVEPHEGDQIVDLSAEVGHGQCTRPEPERCTKTKQTEILCLETDLALYPLGATYDQAKRNRNVIAGSGLRRVSAVSRGEGCEDLCKQETMNLLAGNCMSPDYYEEGRENANMYECDDSDSEVQLAQTVLCEGQQFVVQKVLSCKRANGLRDGEVLSRVADINFDQTLVEQHSSATSSSANIRIPGNAIVKEIRLQDFNYMETKALEDYKHDDVEQRFVPKLFCAGVSDTHVALLQENVAGMGLNEVMEVSREKPLAPEALYRLAEASVDTLHKLDDSHMVHLDVKPDNLVLRYNTPNTSDSENMDERLRRFDTRKKMCLCSIDFGMAKSTRSHEFVNPGEGNLGGTPQYMAPSMVENLARVYEYRDQLAKQKAEMAEAVREKAAPCLLQRCDTTGDRENLQQAEDTRASLFGNAEPVRTPDIDTTVGKQLAPNFIQAAAGCDGDVCGFVSSTPQLNRTRSTLSNCEAADETHYNAGVQNLPEDRQEMLSLCNAGEKASAKSLRFFQNMDIGEDNDMNQDMEPDCRSNTITMGTEASNGSATDECSHESMTSVNAEVASSCEIRKLPAPELKLEASVDCPSFSLAMHAVACGKAFFNLPNATSLRDKIELRLRCEELQRSGNGHVIKSTYLDELQRLEDSNDENDRARFPRWFIRILRQLYTTGNFKTLESQLKEGYQEVFGSVNHPKSESRNCGLFVQPPQCVSAFNVCELGKEMCQIAGVHPE